MVHAQEMGDQHIPIAPLTGQLGSEVLCNTIVYGVKVLNL